METRLLNGDYLPDALGGVVRCQGAQALLERVLFRLRARRGQFPLLPELGSRLHQLPREPAAQRLSAARLYVAEALAGEDVAVTDVALSPGPEGQIQLAVRLDYRGEDLSVTMRI